MEKEGVAYICKVIPDRHTINAKVINAFKIYQGLPYRARMSVLLRKFSLSSPVICYLLVFKAYFNNSLLWIFI